MQRMKTLVFAAAVAAAVLAVQGRVSTQGASEASAAKVNHIGIVTKDLAKTLKEYQRVMGFGDVKAITYPLPLPDGRKASVKVVNLFMPNFQIEINEPVSKFGPYYEHLQKHGMSIMHLGANIPGSGSVDATREAWQAKGGTWVLGEKGGFYAYVDFGAQLGTAVEIIKQDPQKGQAPALPAGDALPPLGALQATHVGWAAADAGTASAFIAGVLGGQAPKVMDYKDSQYPPNHKWNTAAALRIGFYNQGVGMEFIQSVGGPTPWSEYVGQHKGTAPQHLAINVGNKMDEQIADLQKKGGKWTNGKPGGGYAYLDFMDTLGLIFELNGSSKSAPPAAK